MINYILAPWQPANGANEIVYVITEALDHIWLDTLAYLDAILDKDFVIVESGEHQISLSEGPMPPDRSADADWLDGDLYNGNFDIVVDPNRAGGRGSEFYDYIVRHEFGHALGLKHSFSIPSQPFTNDTVMSYTPDSYYYSDLDKAALIYVNGIEDDVPQVYRFYNKLIGSHFYTADVNEAFNVATTMYDTFSFDGTAWEQQEGTIALHRYYNYVTGEHFMTTDLSEITPEHLYFTYEGTVFNVPSEGDPVYRYLNELNGAHLYTTDLNEAPEHYLFEGVGFYV